jgi:hypothetical protein
VTRLVYPVLRPHNRNVATKYVGLDGSGFHFPPCSVARGVCPGSAEGLVPGDVPPIPRRCHFEPTVLALSKAEAGAGRLRPFSRTRRPMQ